MLKQREKCPMDLKVWSRDQYFSVEEKVFTIEYEFPQPTRFGVLFIWKQPALGFYSWLFFAAKQ